MKTAKAQNSAPVLKIKNFGPFKDATINLADFLIIIGKNATGKSLLLYLLWSLESILPDFSTWVTYMRDYDTIIKKALNKLSSGSNPHEEIREYLEKALQYFPKAWSISLKENLPKVLGMNLNEIPRLGTNEAIINITGDYASLKISIKEGEVKAFWEKLDASVMNLFTIENYGTKYLIIKLTPQGLPEEILKYVIETEYDLAKMIMTGLVIFTLNMALGLIPGIQTQPLLVDGRAGIIRAIYRGYPGAALTLREFLKEVLLPDINFVELTYELVKDYSKGLIDTEAIPLKHLLSELGFEIIIRDEFGISRAYIKPRVGPTIPFEKAPSGIRESLPLILALLRKRGYESIYIEEPETHLHPRAIRLLARLMAYTVNKYDKSIAVTTHSDYFLYQVSNLIALSRLSEKELTKLGYTPLEVLKPEQVSAYLLETTKDYVEVKKLNITNEGIDEEAFEEVSRELLEERTNILG